MQPYFRALAVHQAQVHRTFLEAWGGTVGPDRLDAVVDGLVHDGLWLTKFPLLATPTFGVGRLDALDKARRLPGGGPELGREAAALVPLVDADILRFVLGLRPESWEQRVEIFYGGRAMNKPLWNYLAAWFEASTVHRTRWGTSDNLFQTVFT